MSRSRIGVIGGGPGGSSFALSLTNLGVSPADITIVDQAHFPRPKLCGGGLTHRGTELVHALLGEQPLGGGETRGLEFRCAIGAVNVIERGPQWLYDRGHLDNLLLAECKARGVNVVEGERVRDIEPHADGFRVITGATGRDTTHDFSWLVGADGAMGTHSWKLWAANYAWTYRKSAPRGRTAWSKAGLALQRVLGHILQRRMAQLEWQPLCPATLGRTHPAVSHVVQPRRGGL
jgi:flavin-dependent dehydrogenase